MARRSSHADASAYRVTVSQRRLPAEIYWRRRLLLLAVVIAVVWGVLQLTGADGDDEPKAEPTPTKTGAPTASPTPTVPPVPAVQTDGVVDVALQSAAKACDPEKIRVTPTVKPGQLTKGPVDIGLVVSSSGTGACTLQPDDAQAIAVISANGTAIWDSTVCNVPLLTAPVQISPQWATLSTMQWTGRGSGSNCTTNEGYATPGKYTVQIGTLGGEPGKTTFTLDPRPEPPKTTAPPADPATPAAPATSGTPADPAAEPPAAQD
jgi:hypothetical protein